MMHDRISDFRLSIKKLEWTDFSEFVDEETKVENIALGIDFNLEDFNKISSENYSVTVKCDLHFLDQKTNIVTFAILNTKSECYIKFFEDMEIQLEELSDAEKNQLGEAVIKLSWLELRSVLQNILDISDFESSTKLPAVLEGKKGK